MKQSIVPLSLVLVAAAFACACAPKADGAGDGDVAGAAAASPPIGEPAATGGRGVADAGAAKSPASGAPAASSKVVRLRSVFAPEDSGLLTSLAAEFETKTGYHVEVVSEKDVYGSARNGLADIVISHYGHRDVDTFVLEGSGSWPVAVFSNQVALVGPPGDPAHVKGLTDLAEAYKRIAATKSPFVLNDIEGLKYLVSIAADVDGNPDRSGWYVDEGLRAADAIRAAAARGAYTMWGITPFFKLQKSEHLALEPMVTGDPILQRVMVSIVVSPEKYAGANVDGATALQKFLVSPETQAKIRQYRIPEIDAQLWWPAARNNNMVTMSR